MLRRQHAFRFRRLRRSLRHNRCGLRDGKIPRSAGRRKLQIRKFDPFQPGMRPGLTCVWVKLSFRNGKAVEESVVAYSRYAASKQQTPPFDFAEGRNDKIMDRFRAS